MVGAGTVHHPVVDSEEPCICLAVELGELKPTNPVYAVLKKFMSDQ
jgi:anti-sigma factor ChrR (cupin superfamily)